MGAEGGKSTGTLSPALLAALCLLAGGVVLAHLTRQTWVWVAAVATILTEGGLTAMIFIAAGGYGYPLVARLAPKTAPRGLIVVTAVGVGAALLGIAMLVIGSLVGGSLSPWVWWPIVAAGILLAAWWGRHRTKAWRMPKHVDAKALVWVIVALAAGLWLAGATRPAGWWNGLEHEYDVLEYHLQVPREHFDAGHITPLKHNVYSYYPFGLESLFLAGMCLRNGPYDGMYVAKMLHGGFAVLAVAAMIAGLKPEHDTRARFAAVLLATTAFVVFLSWFAMVELAMVFYLTLAVLWLRQWLADRSGRSAVCLGLAVGAACGVKYLSVGFVLAPILAAMIVAGIRKPRKLPAHLGGMLAATLLLFAPWLIRNTIYTGNPVFPLATRVFGAGHWSAESEKRWVDGHAPQVRPPVPKPPNWRDQPEPTWLKSFFKNFITHNFFGPVMMLAAGIGICLVAATPRERADPWDWALIVILGVQLLVWCTATHQMPDRFIMPAVVPLTLLAAGALARLAEVKSNRLVKSRGKKSAQTEAVPWGWPLAVILLVIAAGVNLAIGYNAYTDLTAGLEPRHGVRGGDWADYQYKRVREMGRDYRILLVGEATPYYMPTGTIYATVFDAHPLAEMMKKGLSSKQILAELHRMNVGYIRVRWDEMGRLATSYGFPEPLSRQLFERLHAGRPAGLDVLDSLNLRVVDEQRHPSAGASDWPIITVYALPGVPDPPQPASAPVGQTQGSHSPRPHGRASDPLRRSQKLVAARTRPKPTPNPHSRPRRF